MFDQCSEKHEYLSRKEQNYGVFLNVVEYIGTHEL